MKFRSINPSNYQIISEIESSDSTEIEKKVQLANLAKLEWKKITIDLRVKLLQKVYNEFYDRKRELAELESKEMGMPIKNALEDINETFEYVNWYFENAEKYLNPEITYESKTTVHTVYHEPYGVSAVILPWNFPFSMFVWATLQGMIAGNVIVLKHSEECPLCGKFIEKIFSNHNLPYGIFNEIYGDGNIGKLLVHQKINLIQFIGSTMTGKYLYEVATKHFIRANLEMGGSAPGIIFDDIELETIIPAVCELRLFNSGQCCDGLKRLIVHKDIVDKVQVKMIEIFSQKKIGNPLDESTELGPLVSTKQLNRIKEQVQDAVIKGAKVLYGGRSLEKELGGAFYQPTLLNNISKDMRVWKEEVFGPVLPIVTFSSEEEAITLANDTQYGLGAYIFTENKERGERIAHAIESGLVGINGCSYFAPSSPFGGYKNSGFGREHSKYGFHDVTQIKLIASKKDVGTK